MGQYHMRAYKWIAVPAIALAATLGGCDEGLTGINVNPNEPEVVPPANLLANAQLVGVGLGGYGTNSVWSGLYLTNLWSQHLAQSVLNTEDRYVPRSQQIESIWNQMYFDPLIDLKILKEMAEAEEDGNQLAVAEIFSQYLFQYLTDIYGDIPYSEALQAPDIVRPKYDSQADVYTGMLGALEDATSRINRETRAPDFANGDLIYRGNMEQWYRFGNSLRMRMAMRIREVAPQLAQQHFVAAHQAGAFRGNSDNATLVWAPNIPNQNPRYDHFINTGRVEHLVSAALVDRLEAWGDPRLEVFAEPATLDGEFRGLPNGMRPEEAGLELNEISQIGEAFLQATSPSVLMNYSEVLFLEAEAAQLGWIGGDPAELYRAAIRASMEEHGISEAQTAGYLSQPAVAYTGLPRLWEQQWVALYLVGTEAWSLYRRTGFPELTPAVEGSTIPSRLPYPSPEQLYNPEHYRETTIFDPIWWMG